METITTTKALTPAQQSIQAFTSKINGNYVQTQLQKVLGANAGSFATSIVEVFTNDKQLQLCDPNKVVQEAIKAATLKLPLNKQLGYAYLLTFNNYDRERRQSVPTPTLVIGYRGYIQMAMRTGQYRNINSDVVYEGELKAKDKLTGEISLDGEKTSDKVVGFFAHFALTNGFTKTIYMSLQQMADYALKFSPSLRNSKMNIDQLCDMAQKQAIEGPVKGVDGWTGDFLAMAQKTVLRRLLSKYGFLSIEMMSALAEDENIPDTADIRDQAQMTEKPVFAPIPASPEFVTDAVEVDTTDDDEPEMPI